MSNAICILKVGTSVFDGTASTESVTDGDTLGQIVVNGKVVREWIPRCHQSLDAVAPPYMMYILSQLEPSSLSLAALKALCTGRGKHIPKTAMVELITFSTGFDVEGGDFKQDLHYCPYLVYVLKQMMVMRDRPLRGILLPPNWPSIGIYKVQRKVDGNITFLHTILNKDAGFPNISPRSARTQIS